MTKYTIIVPFLIIQALITQGQERLELLETNVKQDVINNYADSYLWTKNWWLASGMVIDTSRGGNTMSRNSILTKQKIDSLHYAFTKYISPDLIRFGNLVPRIVYKLDNKAKPYIISTIYELREEKSKPIVQFKIEFDKRAHNKMPDIYSVSINNLDQVNPQTDKYLYSLLKRKPTVEENNITPPKVEK